VYDVTHNRGFACVGTSGDTPAFAADTIAAWWQADGQTTWPNNDHVLVLADAGGSNNCRSRAWKERVQTQICNRFGLTVTVCHYPTGCSKWNPIANAWPNSAARNTRHCAFLLAAFPTAGPLLFSSTMDLAPRASYRVVAPFAASADITPTYWARGRAWRARLQCAQEGVTRADRGAATGPELDRCALRQPGVSADALRRRKAHRSRLL
jgi:hypothetical protein